MSYSEEKNSEHYDGLGSSGQYSIPFRFQDATWLEATVIHADGTTAAVTSFTLTGQGPLGTAKLITSAAAAGTTLVIARRSPATQNLSLIPNAPLPAKDLEKALDHLAMAIRDRDVCDSKATSRALCFPVSEQEDHNTRLPMSQLRKGMYLGFHHETGEMEVRPPSAFFHEGMTTALAAIQSAKAATLTVLDQAVEKGAELLAKIPLFYKRETGGGISFGEVTGDPAGSYAINLQAYRQDPSNVASGPQSISIGNMRAWGQNAIAIGHDGNGPGTFTTSVGTSNNAGTNFSSAFGYRNTLSGHYALALGHENYGGHDFTTAVGANNAAVGYYASAIGYRNGVSGEMASAGGVDNYVTGSHASAFGYGNASVGQNAAAFGYKSQAGAHSVALGNRSFASDNGATAVGVVNRAEGQEAVAIGISNTAASTADCAIGIHNTASGGYSNAIGRSNYAGGSGATAVGTGNNASQSNSMAAGYNNYAGGSESGAFGSSSSALGYHSMAFGYGAVVNAASVTELGNISYGSYARVRADGPSCRVALSFGYNQPAATYAAVDIGHEPSGTLAEQMLSFRTDEYTLFIDVCLQGTVRTISIPLP